MTTQPLPTPESNGIAVEWLLNGQVMAITVTNSTRTTIDKFIQIIKDEEKDWPDDKIGLFLFDFTKSLAGFSTPYGNSRMHEVLEWRPEIASYSAVLVPNNFLVQIARVFLNKLNKRAKTQTKMFFSREEALTWLGVVIATKLTRS